MSANQLGPFPVDDITLDALEHALNGSLRMVDGEPMLEGADYSLSALLDFLSGYDPSAVVALELEDGHVVDDMYEYVGGPLYHLHDVIRALIAEVRRLRKEHDERGPS